MAERERRLSSGRRVSTSKEALIRSRRRSEIIHQLSRAYAGQPQKSELRTLKRMKAKFRSTLSERW